MTKPNARDWLRHLGRWLGRILGFTPSEAPTTNPVEIPMPPPPPSPPDPPSPPSLPRLWPLGYEWAREDGTRWEWRGQSGFDLLHKLTTERLSDVVAFLDWAAEHGDTVARVFTTATKMFSLAPQDGRQALPALLKLANARGIYVEAVCLADTALRLFDIPEHVQKVGVIAAQFTNCFVEIANEPNHETQLPEVANPAYLSALRGFIPSNVPVALGAAHGKDDKSRAYIGGDYVTVHVCRDEGDGGWRAVRHTKEARDLQAEIGKPVVDDEPQKELAPDKQRAKGMLARVLNLGTTFHYEDGKVARIPTGAALEAFEAWRAGLNELPSGWTGAFYNAGWPDSPIKSADWNRVVRVYSAVNGDTAYSVLLGVTGDPCVELGDGWALGEKRSWGGAELWRIQR